MPMSSVVKGGLFGAPQHKENTVEVRGFRFHYIVVDADAARTILIAALSEIAREWVSKEIARVAETKEFSADTLARSSVVAIGYPLCVAALKVLERDGVNILDQLQPSDFAGMPQELFEAIYNDAAELNPGWETRLQAGLQGIQEVTADPKNSSTLSSSGSASPTTSRPPRKRTTGSRSRQKRSS